MTDDGAMNRRLSRALANPVRRAMHRMRSSTIALESANGPRPGHSSVVDCGLYVDGVRQPGDWHYRDALLAARRSDGFVWLGLKEPDATELADIGETFGLHEVPVEVARKSHQRPKGERYNDMTFVTLRTARYCEHDELTETSEVVESGDV